MKLSTRTRYGLRAVVAIANAAERGIIARRKPIAEEQELSESYLENILIILKKSDIIKTKRGIDGGYMLTRKPEDITVLEVVSALEGTIDLVECISRPSKCHKSDRCATRTVWRELASSWNTILGSITLREMIEREDALHLPDTI